MFGVCGSVGQYTSVKSNNPLVCHNLPGKCEKYSLHIPSLFPLVKCPKSDFCLSVYVQYTIWKCRCHHFILPARLPYQIIHDSFCAQLYAPIPIWLNAWKNYFIDTHSWFLLVKMRIRLRILQNRIYYALQFWMCTVTFANFVSVHSIAKNIRLTALQEVWDSQHCKIVLCVLTWTVLELW